MSFEANKITAALLVAIILAMVSGILADLMDTPARALVTASVWVLVAAYVFWSLLALGRIPQG